MSEEFQEEDSQHKQINASDLLNEKISKEDYQKPLIENIKAEKKLYCNFIESLKKAYPEMLDAVVSNQLDDESQKILDSYQNKWGELKKEIEYRDRNIKRKTNYLLYEICYGLNYKKWESDEIADSMSFSFEDGYPEEPAQYSIPLSLQMSVFSVIPDYICMMLSAMQLTELLGDIKRLIDNNIKDNNIELPDILLNTQCLLEIAKQMNQIDYDDVIKNQRYIIEVIKQQWLFQPLKRRTCVDIICDILDKAGIKKIPTAAIYQKLSSWNVYIATKGERGTAPLKGYDFARRGFPGDFEEWVRNHYLDDFRERHRKHSRKKKFSKKDFAYGENALTRAAEQQAQEDNDDSEEFFDDPDGQENTCSSTD